MQPIEKDTFLASLNTSICKQRSIDINAFKQNTHIHLGADFSVHVAWAFDNVYSKRYPGMQVCYVDEKQPTAQYMDDFNNLDSTYDDLIDTTNTEDKDSDKIIARYNHGIQHVSRAAYYAPIFANLLRKHGEMIEISEEDLKLIQIAILFHDSARMGESDDLWDRESAVLAYTYMKYIVNVSEEKAILLAEAIANKDANEKNFYNMVISESGEVDWVYNPQPHPKSHYQILIHDVDSTDIMRVIEHFSQSYLDTFKIFHAKNNQNGLNTLSNIINEIRTLTDFQGDNPTNSRPFFKKKYENRFAYQEILSSVQSVQCSLLSELYNSGHLIPYDLSSKKEKLPDTGKNTIGGLTTQGLFAQDNKINPEEMDFNYSDPFNLNTGS